MKYINAISQRVHSGLIPRLQLPVHQIVAEVLTILLFTMKFNHFLPALAALVSHVTAGIIPCPLEGAEVSTPTVSARRALNFQIISDQTEPVVIDGFINAPFNPDLLVPILKPARYHQIEPNYYLEEDGAIVDRQGFVFGRYVIEDKSFLPKSLYFGPKPIMKPLTFDFRDNVLVPREDSFSAKGIILSGDALRVQLIPRRLLRL